MVGSEFAKPTELDGPIASIYAVFEASTNSVGAHVVATIAPWATMAEQQSGLVAQALERLLASESSASATAIAQASALRFLAALLPSLLPIVGHEWVERLLPMLVDRVRGANAFVRKYAVDCLQAVELTLGAATVTAFQPEISSTPSSCLAALGVQRENTISLCC